MNDTKRYVAFVGLSVALVGIASACWFLGAMHGARSALPHVAKAYTRGMKEGIELGVEMAIQRIESRMNAARMGPTP